MALELIRVLARAGHTVYACDSFAPTLASGSRHLSGHFVLPPPRQQTYAYGAALLDLVAKRRIDWLIPTCEEVFYVGRFHAALAERTRVLAAPLEELATWHDKGAFQQRAAALGLTTPQTTVVRDRTELLTALARTPDYLLKPAWSRFATRIITNRGPRPNPAAVAACQPTPAAPWLVQEFIDGEAVCSYSILHGGRVTGHCAYRTPHRVGGGAGCSFLSTDGAATLAIVQRLTEATGITGQLSFDFLRDASGRHWLLECNPRATSAVHVMQPARLADALVSPPAGPPWLEPPGRYSQLLLVVLGQTPWALAHNPPLDWLRDVVLDPNDPLPALWQIPQVLRFLGLAWRERIDPLAATTHDIEWNGPDAA